MVSLDDLLAECFDNDGSAAAAQSAHVALHWLRCRQLHLRCRSSRLVSATRWKEPR